jgi:hypothetical protein
MLGLLRRSEVCEFLLTRRPTRCDVFIPAISTDAPGLALALNFAHLVRVIARVTLV